MPSQNLVLNSEDGSQASWNKNTGVTAVVSTDVPPPVPNMLITKIVYDGSGAAGTFRFYDNGATLAAGGPDTVSVWLRTLSGTASVRVWDGGVTQTGPLTITTTWQHFSFTSNPWPGSTAQFLIYSPIAINTAFTIYATGMQRETSGAAGDYVRTTSATINLGSPTNKRLPQNLAIQSEALSTTPWTNTNLSAPVATLAPDGTLAAQTFTDTAANSTHVIEQSVAAIVVGRKYTVTCRFKKIAGAGWVIITGNAGVVGQYFDIGNGIRGTGGGVGFGFIRSISAGWYECSFQYTATGPLVEIYMAPSDSVSSYVGGTNQLAVWHYQHEQSDATGDYVQTTTVAAL